MKSGLTALAITMTTGYNTGNLRYRSVWPATLTSWLGDWRDWAAAANLSASVSPVGGDWWSHTQDFIVFWWKLTSSFSVHYTVPSWFGRQWLFITACLIGHANWRTDGPAQQTKLNPKVDVGRSGKTSGKVEVPWGETGGESALLCVITISQYKFF